MRSAEFTNIPMSQPCPSCPDGNEWDSNGPTGRACKTCGGFAILHLNGSKMTKKEFEESCHD